MIWRRWLPILAAIASCCRLSSAQQTCCYAVEDEEIKTNLSLQYEFSTIEVPGSENFTEWDLQINISWSRVVGYDRYIVEVEVENSEITFCFEFLTCTFDGLSENNWKVFSGVQFGSVQQVTMYITEVGETVRGPYIRDYTDSPDCYDETKSIDFCRTQPVQYAGKPIDVEVVNMTLTEDEERVIVTIGWRQPAHINEKTPLSYYQMFVSGEETAMSNIRIMNISYESGGYVITELDEPLFTNTNYTLELSAVVNSNGMNKRGLVREIIFITLSPTVITAVPETTESNLLIIAIVVSGSAILLVGVTLIFIWKFYSDRFIRLIKDDEDDDILDLDVIIPNRDKRRPTLIAYPAYELARSDISWTERKELGRGYYGEVYKCSAVIDGVPTEAAVKVPKQFATSTEIEDFIHEISLVIKLGSHPNLVRFLGCVTSSNPLMMVNEFVRYGDMFSFMQKIKNKKAPKEAIYNIQRIDQLNISRQVARGMEYIASQRCVHGDLAARNVLVGEDLVVKITDFGLSRDIYASNYVRLTKEAKLPWKWYSIEAMTGERKLTTKGDIWSFGVVLFEVFTFCDPPYPLIPSLSALVEFLESGGRMKQPQECPDEIYSIMLKCWNANPRKRPSFTQLVAEFEKLIAAESGSDYLPVIAGDNLTLNQSNRDLLSEEEKCLSDTSSVDSEQNSLESDNEQVEVDYENVISSKSTYTTDIGKNDVGLEEEQVKAPEEDGYIQPMKDEDYAAKKARKINSLKDTKYDVLPLKKNKPTTEDGEGYMTPTDIKNPKETKSENQQARNPGPKYDVFLALDNKKNLNDVLFENEVNRQDNEGYTEIDEDKNRKLELTKNIGDVLFDDDNIAQPSDGYTEIDDDDVANNPVEVKDIFFENELPKQYNDGYTEVEDDDNVVAQQPLLSNDGGDIFFENDVVHRDNDGYTEIDDDEDKTQKTSTLDLDEFQTSGMYRYMSKSSGGSVTPTVDRDDIYFGKELVYKKDSKGNTVVLDEKYSRGFKSNIHKKDDVFFETEIPQRQDSEGYTVIDDEDNKFSVGCIKSGVKKTDSDPNDIYFGNELTLRQDSAGYTLPDDEDNTSKSVDFKKKDVGLDRKDVKGIYGKFLIDKDVDKQINTWKNDEQVYENIKRSKAKPTDDSKVPPLPPVKPEMPQRMKAPKEEIPDVHFDNDTDLPVDNDDYILPDNGEPKKRAKHKTNSKVQEYEVVDYENVTSIKVATEEECNKDGDGEEIYVNSKVDPELWKKTPFNYF